MTTIGEGLVPALPLRSDLVRRIRLFQRHAAWVGSAISATLLAMMIGDVVIARALERRGLSWVGMLLIATQFAVALLVSNFVTRRLVAKYGVRCPYCRRVFDKYTAPVAVATGLCGLCAARVAQPES